MPGAKKSKKVQTSTAKQRAAQSARDKAAYRAGFGGRAGPRLPSGKFFSKGPKGQALSAPVATSIVMRTGVPRLENSIVGGDARIRVRHREYISDVTGAASFTCQQFPINPGMVAVFPWLSSIAQNYESYKFRALQFEYEPRCSTATAGSVMSAIDYDAADSVPTNKVEIMAQHNAVSSALWEENCFMGDKADLTKFGVQRYIRTGALAANLDIKTYDVGNLNLASQGGPGTDVGELYVVYDVELMTPQLGAASVGNSSKLVGVAPSKTSVFGVSPTLTGTISMSATLNTMTFNQVGGFLVQIDSTGTSVGAVAATGTASNTFVANVVNSAGTEQVTVWIVNVTAPGQTFIVDFSSSSTITASTSRLGSYAYALG